MRMRVVAIGLATSLAGLAVQSDSRAQPAPAPDFARAKQLYDAGTSELAMGAFTDAIRDLGAAEEITKDPVLYYKLGEANERAGHCEIALDYFGRYLREAKPSPHYIDLTKEHVAACGGDWRAINAPAPVAVPVPVPAVGSAGSGSAVTPDPLVPASDPGGGSDPGPAPVAPVTIAHATNDLPWLMVGGALAFVTAGAVFAYSATSSENDLKDLYMGVTSAPPLFDATVAKRYQDLLDQGHRYQYLSLASFGVATGFAVAAVLLFVHDHNEQQRRLLLTPTASPSGAGVAATLHF
jgi:hypothetical protein